MVYAIVRNLLSNALKFTEPGGKVTIDVVKKDDFLNVSVADTGIGMQQDDVARLFRIDSKYQRAGTAGEEGTGLGLLLSKELVEKNGGMLVITSEAGKGTTVVFTLPLHQPE
jgi:two-component system, sensor histidine kinase and response regulator